MGKIASILEGLGTGRLKLIGYGLAAICLISATTWVVVQWNDLQDLRKENVALKADNKSVNKQLLDNKIVYDNNLKKCTDSNANNNETIKQLLKERDEAKLATDELAKKQQNTADNLKKLQDNLRSLEKTGNGPISQYMRETIRGLQKVTQ